MADTKLLVTVGLPRSGKTTLCNQVYRPQGFVVVNPDSVRLAIHGYRFLASAEPFVWATTYAMVDALRLAGHDVIVDGCHGSKKRREPWKQRGAEFVLVDTPKEECIRRAHDTNDEEIIRVIERMASEYEPIEQGEQNATPR